MKLFYLVLISVFAYSNVSEFAAGHPGIVPNWSSAKKVHVGTSYPSSFENNNQPQSLVWFTLAHGVLTEVYYPTIDKAQIKDSQILVSDEKSFFVEERTQVDHLVNVVSPSKVQVINHDKKNRFKITHEYFTMNSSSVLVDKVTIESNVDGLNYYLLINPALNNTGYKDSAIANNNELSFYEGATSLKVTSSIGFSKTSVGFVGNSDGYQDLKDDFKLNNLNIKALNGNVAGTAQLKLPKTKGVYEFYVVYNFSKNKLVNNIDYNQQQINYHNAWDFYLKQIKVPKKLNQKQKELYLRSLYVLRVHEDKLFPGALVASLSKPWGDEIFEWPGVFTGGYHLVWPRDLYHVSTALLNAGDRAAALRALRYLKKIQYQSGIWNYGARVINKKGAWPQNVWTHGGEYWSGFQLDQTGYPVQLFYQLYKSATAEEKKHLMAEFKTMVLDAARFIQLYGPWSAQERWEENFGISPSSFSAATAALIQMDSIFPDEHFKNTAMTWLHKPNDNIHTWTFTTSGMYGDGQYYLRVGGCENYLAVWNPDLNVDCTIANSGQRVSQKAILDQGFLKLALMGLVGANDWRIKTSLAKVNEHIKIQTPKGSGWYRYSYDAYGENKRGRLWPLLSSEHGRYEIELYRVEDQTWEDTMAKINPIIDSYLGFANDGLMLPEQVFEHNGEGTGAATPLAWSHAEYIKLLWSVDKQKNVENLFQ